MYYLTAREAQETMTETYGGRNDYGSREGLVL